MLGLLDRVSLRRRMKSFDDQSVSFRRKYGAGSSRVIVFLPWSMSIETAEAFHLLPNSYFACIEMPNGIVSSTPQIPVDCLTEIDNALEDDFAAIGAAGQEPLLVGMSMGNFPATYLANKKRLDLISIASGHSGDWLTFNSPAARHIRRKAESGGFKEADFAPLLGPISPLNNIGSLGPRSQFVFGTHDHYIPKTSRDALINRLENERPSIRITKVPLGHIATILLWKCLIQRDKDI